MKEERFSFRPCLLQIGRRAVYLLFSYWFLSTIWERLGPFPSTNLPAWGNSAVVSLIIILIMAMVYWLAELLGQVVMLANLLWQKAKTRLARGQRLIG